MHEQCFYDPKSFQVIDTIAPDGLGHYGRRTQAELAAEYPGLEVLATEVAWQRHCDHYKTAPVAITEEQWDYYLNVLPPCQWVHGAGGESFFMSERTTGNITLHVVCIGQRYYSFQDEDTLTHEAKIEKCLPLHTQLTAAS